MTNYNERLDEILDDFFTIGTERHISELKQSITSLIKDLVAEALKKIKKEVIGEVPSKMNTDNWKYDRRVAELKLWQHQAIDQYEQNLLKALEDKNV